MGDCIELILSFKLLYLYIWIPINQPVLNEMPTTVLMVLKTPQALNNWQFLPKPELADNSTKKKLRLGIPTGGSKML